MATVNWPSEKSVRPSILWCEGAQLTCPARLGCCSPAHARQPQSCRCFTQRQKDQSRFCWSCTIHQAGLQKGELIWFCLLTKKNQQCYGGVTERRACLEALSLEVAQCCWSRAAEARGSSLQVGLCALCCCIHWQTCLETAAWGYQACFSLGANSSIPMGFYWTRLCLYLSVSNSTGHLQATSARSTSALLCFWFRIGFVHENTGHF